MIMEDERKTSFKPRRSRVTTAPGHDFGLKAGKQYEVVGYPMNTNSGVIVVIDEAGAQTFWAESYFDEAE